MTYICTITNKMQEYYPILFFLLASYSVIANDSIQTLGTWIASNKDRTPWYYLAIFASLGLIMTVSYSWYFNDGDISYGRLEKIPFQTIEWYHGIAPLALIVLTRFSIPASTSFLILSTMANNAVIGQMFLKSVLGYVVAAVVAFVFWVAVSKVLDEKKSVRGKNKKAWRTAQWFSTGFLWWSWLSHDVANISVFLPRQISFEMLLLILVFFTVIMFIIFREGGGKIQGIVLSKTNTKYVRSATIIDFVYAIILLYFKELNSIPMSTTWVFIGLLSGREVAISALSEHRKIKKLFPILRGDFWKLIIGMSVSIAIAILVNYIATGEIFE
ncbi:MAG: hypothetical protein ACJAVW_000431 [Spirosomataceae bacterium]